MGWLAFSVYWFSRFLHLRGVEVFVSLDKICPVYSPLFLLVFCDLDSGLNKWEIGLTTVFLEFFIAKRVWWTSFFFSFMSECMRAREMRKVKERLSGQEKV
jgi:hypothetical protein